jgi:linoleoyl-CoA desaturase
VLDYQKYFKRRIGVTPLKMTFREHIFFWISKMLNLFLFIGLPIYFVGFSHWLIGFIIYTFVSGFIMSIVFQLAHTVEDTNFPEVNNLSGRIEDDWALHQLKTTANFSTKSKLINWFVGGLNFQIEHHLFPKVSHVHYPQIQKIIKEACKKFNFPYIEYSGLSRAITSHVYYLKKMGR